MTGYEDIIHLPHHRSSSRPHMSIHDRAAQFSPFAALTGFESAIEEAGRITDSRIELEEYGRNILAGKLGFLLEQLKNQPRATITYFLPDDRKNGGSYREITGAVHKIDLYYQRITMMDGLTVPIEDILNITLDV